MPEIHLNLCNDCLKALLISNPYVDKHGKAISLKGIHLKKVSSQVCDNHFKGAVKTDKIELTAMRCCNCQKEVYIRVNKGSRPTCPVCRSIGMVPLEVHK